jgi:EAL domain-containing protein (putative c-di-GMP-specific phosphodiesterase class I)
MRIVAEGVEDAPTYGVLSDLGCDVAQGYFISRPLPELAMTSWLIERNTQYEGVVAG